MLLNMPPGSAIDVILHQTKEKAVVQFKDHGPGIPKRSLPLIFERFYRARSEKATGTGLGLFICKQITDAHRGKIWQNLPWVREPHFSSNCP